MCCEGPGGLERGCCAPGEGSCPVRAEGNPGVWSEDSGVLWRMHAWWLWVGDRLEGASRDRRAGGMSWLRRGASRWLGGDRALEATRPRGPGQAGASRQVKRRPQPLLAASHCAPEGSRRGAGLGRASSPPSRGALQGPLSAGGGESGSPTAVGFAPNPPPPPPCKSLSPRGLLRDLGPQPQGQRAEKETLKPGALSAGSLAPPHARRSRTAGPPPTYARSQELPRSPATG